MNWRAATDKQLHMIAYGDDKCPYQHRREAEAEIRRRQQKRELSGKPIEAARA
jgi:hypothetical protein